MKLEIDEVRAFHPTPWRRGHVAICYRRNGDIDGGMVHEWYHVSQLGQAIQKFLGKTDVWVSMGEFARSQCDGTLSRKTENLHLMQACFVDVDYYKSAEYKYKEPEDVAYLIDKDLGDLGIPLPTCVVYSGRGLQLVWAFNSPILAAGVHHRKSRWKLVQKVLCGVLQEYGADPAATDPSRILRIPGTINSRSGEMVCVITLRKERTTSLDALAGALLAIPRHLIHTTWGIEHLRACYPPHKPTQPKMTTSHQWCPHGGDGDYTSYDKKLLSDLYAVRDGHRDPCTGDVPEGERDLLLLAILSTRGLIAGEALRGNMAEIEEIARAEAIAISRSWGTTLNLSTVGTAMRKIAAGEPYRWKPETLCDILKLTSEEEAKMQVLRRNQKPKALDPEKRRRQCREAAQRYRAKRGVRSREEITEQAKQRAAEIAASGVSVSTWYARRAKERAARARAVMVRDLMVVRCRALAIARAHAPRAVRSSMTPVILSPRRSRASSLVLFGFAHSGLPPLLGSKTRCWCRGEVCGVPRSLYGVIRLRGYPVVWCPT